MSETESHVSINYPKSRQRKLNSSIRLMHRRGLVNMSRRLVQNHLTSSGDWRNLRGLQTFPVEESRVNQSINSGASLRNNNVSLAKKVSELQIELNTQKMAAQKANIGLVKCHVELMRLQSYEEARERIKNAFLNIHESLCSQMGLGISVINLVKETMCLLDSNGSSNQVTKCNFINLPLNPLPPGETSNVGPSSQPFEENLSVPSFPVTEEEELPETLATARTCVSQNNDDAEKETLTRKTVEKEINDNLDFNSPIHSPINSFRHLENSLQHHSTSESPVINLQALCNQDSDVVPTSTTETATVPPPVGVVNRNENNVVVHHEDCSTRSHLVRQARLNSKPIIDTSSFLEPPVVKRKTKKVVKRRLIRSADSKNTKTMKQNDDINKTDGKSRSKSLKVRKTNNPDIVESVPQQTGRIIETCFRRPEVVLLSTDRIIHHLLSKRGNKRQDQRRSSPTVLQVRSLLIVVVVTKRTLQGMKENYHRELNPQISGSQPPDSNTKESNSRKGKFRRLYLHDHGDENDAVGSSSNSTAPSKSLRNKSKSTANIVVDPLITTNKITLFHWQTSAFTWSISAANIGEITGIG
ncbi:unnamed protein product [Trichobilharzia szidati]|nr:unnamed protein product [Trichobilharzia szidati]